jgi:hypothetical protein
MGTKMTRTARAELTNVVRRRYLAATGAEKRRILDEFIAVTGYHNKSAIRALNAEPIASSPNSRRAILDFITAAICVRCGVACRSAAAKPFSG